jgi:hypothetical protein
MSGGHWNYGHDQLFEAARQIEKMAAQNPYGDEAATLAEFSTAASVMRRAAIYWRRIDWLVSADDSAESFHRRLQTELTALDAGTFRTLDDEYSDEEETV